MSNAVCTVLLSLGVAVDERVGIGALLSVKGNASHLFRCAQKQMQGKDGSFQS